MPELRRDPIVGRWVIIATERARRPSEFTHVPPATRPDGLCPFCPGHEEMTPPAVAVYTDQGIMADGEERLSHWQMRVFPNLFAAMVP